MYIYIYTYIYLYIYNVAVICSHYAYNVSVISSHSVHFDVISVHFDAISANSAYNVTVHAISVHSADIVDIINAHFANIIVAHNRRHQRAFHRNTDVSTSCTAIATGSSAQSRRFHLRKARTGK